jgi:quercetin 2,3-dioxygenase
MQNSFILRAGERGHDLIRSSGKRSSHIAGHPEGFVSRESSFNFHEYQSGRPGFGAIRVFGDEVFAGAGVGYNLHPHHNFVICAFVLQGELTHINTVGRGAVDQLHQGDYYVFSAGSGGKHCELSITGEDAHVIYIWLLPKQLSLPPSYDRAHFDFRLKRNRIVELVGDRDGALPIPQDARISRLIGDKGRSHAYAPRSRGHGSYVFVLEGELRVGDVRLSRRDSMGLWATDRVDCEVAADATDVMLVETIMPSGAGKLEAQTRSSGG